MKIHRIIGISIVALSTVAPAFAATSPTVEPGNGFVTGPEPEWAASHAQDTQSTPEHRQYHRDEAQAHLEWHKQNQTSTMGYDRLHRDMHQARNLDHRMFHDSTYAPESTEPSGSTRAPVIPSSPTAPTVTPPPAGSTGTERTYDGSRPSRRSIMQNAENRARR